MVVLLLLLLASCGGPSPRVIVVDEHMLAWAEWEAARAAGWQSELIDFRGDTAAQLRDALARHGASP